MVFHLEQLDAREPCNDGEHRLHVHHIRRGDSADHRDAASPGYVYFANARSLTSVRKIDGKISWRAAKGDAQQNFDYCTKDGRNVHERGVAPKTATEKETTSDSVGETSYVSRNSATWTLFAKSTRTFISTSSAASTLFTRHASEASRTLMASWSTSGLLALAAAASLVLLAMRTLVLLLN